MTRSLSIMEWGRAWLGALLLTLATLGASAASPKRVLMVFREASQVPANVMIERAVLYAWIFRDVSGRAFFPARALEMLIENASVPVHVLVDSQLGSSAVCGLPGIIAVSSAEEVSPGSPSALKP